MQLTSLMQVLLPVAVSDNEECILTCSWKGDFLIATLPRR